MWGDPKGSPLLSFSFGPSGGGAIPERVALLFPLSDAGPVPGRGTARVSGGCFGMPQAKPKPHDQTRRTVSTVARPAAKSAQRVGRARLSPGARSCRAKFLEYFPKGFRDPEYVELERAYKWNAHQRWEAALGRDTFSALLEAGKFDEIASRVVSIEARTNLLFSFEKMALRDGIKGPGAEGFARGLFDFLYAKQDMQRRFERWCAVVGQLPRRQTRVLTWPIVTVWGFLAQPRTHVYLKPTVTRRAAEQYEFSFDYRSQPNWATYASLLAFARTIAQDMHDLQPRDMIDIQSFIWVQGSDEYPD